MDDSPEAQPAAVVPPLFHIPGHEVVREIARGGMGIVYQARQLEPAREVAVKMLLPFQATSPGMRERFRIEARAIAALDHPGILPIYQVGEHDGTPYFTLKLASGGSLASRLGSYSGCWRAIAELVATVTDAVQFAHEHGVLHRDLKPGNILFDECGRAYVSDFGLAKDTTTDTDLTRSTDFLGTPHYVAPEVAAHSARAATIASDVYSLGAILYELLAGRPPFEADGVPALLKKIAEEAPVAPLKRLTVESSSASTPQPCNAATIHDLETICLKCLDKEPPRRYGTAAELAHDLRRWLAGEPILARETSSLEKLWLWSRRHRVTASLVAAVFASLLVLVLGLSFAAVRIADSRSAALQTVEDLESQKANGLFTAGSTAEAIALLARRVRENPKNWADATRLMWAIHRRQWAVPSRAPWQPAINGLGGTVPVSYLVKGTNERLLSLHVGTNLVVHDVLGATNIHDWPLPFRPEGTGLYREADIVLTDRDGRAWFFDYLKGRMLPRTVLVLKPPAALNVALDELGRRAFVVAPDYSGQLVDLRTGDAQILVPPPAANESGRAHIPVGRFFADHRRLAYSDRDRTVRILDCDSGLLADQKFTLSQDVDNIAISPDGQVLVTLTADATQFWEVGSGRELPTRPEVGVSLRPGTFRPDSSQYYQAGNAFGLVRYDPLNGKLSELPARGRLWTGHCMADPVERKVAVRFERVVGLYDMETGQPLCQPLPVVHSQTCDGRLTRQGFAAVTRDGDLTLWELNTNRFATIVLRHRAPVQLARFSTDGQRVVTASHDGSARIWDARTGQMVGGPMVHGDKVWSADFSPDGRRVVTASWDATARLWDATTGAPLSPPLPARHFVFHVEFSPDGSRFLAGGEDGMLRIYDAVTGGLLLELRETGQVYWAHFSPDGRMIVTRPFNANPKLWDARSGALIRELNEPPQRQTSGGVVTRGDFSRDGSWLALGSANRYATVWHLPEGKRHAVLNHLAVVRSACFSPDGQTVLTTSDDLTGQLWNARTGEASSPALAGQWSSEAPPNTGNSMRAAAIHPDGRRAVTGGSDAAARLWDLRNGLSLGEPVELAGSVMHAEFSPDGRRLLLACFDGSAHILSLPPIVERAPEWLAPLAEALVGQRSVARGAAEIVPPAALWNVCETIRRAPAQDEAARWARDCLGL